MTAFPARFLFGSATSSHQVEGGNHHNDWWDWEARPGAIADGERSGDAAGWWAGRAEEDLARAAALGQNAHRMSLEWSRLEPEPGRFDRAAFDRYRAILDAARALGLEVALTLNHFTLPSWAAKLGGWTHPNLPALFEGFADRAARELGDRVALWATLNEPSVLAWMAYAGDRWPPGEKRLPSAFVAMRHMLEAHARGYEAVHRVLPHAEVGLVLNMPWFVPADPSRRLDRVAASLQDWAFSGAMLHALRHGELRFPLSWTRRRAPSLAGRLDWVGLNYYGRFDVRFDPRAAGSAFGRHVQEPTVKTEHNDWGRPSPEGMVAQLERLAALGVPLYVTENGMFDPDDTRRPRYLVEHVEALERAIARGLDVRGYFVWSLVDNFEWAEGWSTPFGLYALDRASGARTPRRSAEVYAAICRAREVPTALRTARAD
ncbi:MAG: glycoside hydrolase family 1 protein [Sandaracinaceae bacterium]|nr:glycoside hydrolase family 1 protein [Sandaracinaceae bacterium]